MGTAFLLTTCVRQSPRMASEMNTQVASLRERIEALGGYL